MKNILYIVALLGIYLLFSPSQEEVMSNDASVAGQEAVMKEKSSAADMQHRIEIISNELKNSNGCTPRRNIQPTNSSHLTSLQKQLTRSMYEIRVKGADQLQKVSEYIAYCQTSNYSALLCRMGYHVYALRKIII